MILLGDTICLIQLFPFLEYKVWTKNISVQLFQNSGQYHCVVFQLLEKNVFGENVIKKLEI